MSALKWTVPVLAFLAHPAFSQIISQTYNSSGNQTTISSSSTGVVGPGSAANVVTLPYRLEAHAEPTSPPILIGQGFNSRGSEDQMMVHRFFRDDDAHEYFGYDMLLEPGPSPDTHLATFFELGMGVLDVALGRGVIVKPAEWKKLLPTLPAPQVVHVGDTISVVLRVDPNTGQKLLDDVHIQQPQTTRRAINMALPLGRSGLLPGFMSAPAFTPPTVSGTARSFSAADAELRLTQTRVKINGKQVEDPTAVRSVVGPLVWFYLPHRGRYILSLAPRPELGFTKNGEVRGGVATFKDGPDELTLESYQEIAPGGAPYVLYVLHDPEWAPTVASQMGMLRIGSVSPGEIAALMKK
jgi:hypothetical protein